MSDKLLENLFKKTRKTRVFGIRIPARIYLIYELLDFTAEDISELRQLVSAYIVSKAIEKGLEIPDEIKQEFKNLVSKTTQNNNVIFNINISKSESKAEAKVDVSKLLELMNELERIINWIETHNWRKEQNSYVVPPAVLKELNDTFAKIKRLVN